MERLKVAVAGTNVGSALHVRALQAAGFDVVALIGRDPERTADKARHFGIATASTSVEAIIDSDIDALVIATPPATHHPLAMEAMKAGKHVLCEKPLAVTAALAREMRDAAEAFGVVAILQHQFRWRQQNAMLRDLVRGGELGELLHGTFAFDFPMTQHGPLDVPDWWLASETGGGWLRNWNTHGIDLVRYTVGEFGAVTGRLHADRARGMSADDAYAIGFVLANGMEGAMTGTCRSWDFNAEWRLIGAKRTAIVRMRDMNAAASLFLIDGEGRREIEPDAAFLKQSSAGVPRGENPAPGLLAAGEGVYQAVHTQDHYHAEQVALCTAFRRSILERGYTHAAIASFADGVAAMDVIEAVERSAREGRWIDIDRAGR